jgi:hypothetical protein
MSTQCKTDPSKFDEFSKEVMSSVFQEKLKNAVAHSDSRDANMSSINFSLFWHQQANILLLERWKGIHH